MIVHVNQVHVATHEVPAKSWLTAHEKNGCAVTAYNYTAPDGATSPTNVLEFNRQRRQRCGRRPLPGPKMSRCPMIGWRQ